MAEFTDRIKLIYDVVADHAVAQTGKLKSGVADAEGGFGKLKAAAGGALDTLTSSPAAMAGVVAGIGKVAFDLASGFQDAAIAAQDFATASGLSVEQASRWQEVAGDVGVNTDALEGAVNKLNIAASKGALTELGIGGADTNEKLLNALTHLHGITDATERAKQGAALFGKSWAQLAPLVESSGDLAANLAAVSDAKVIDEGEVAKAQEMREAMDRLSDTLDDIKLALGEALIGPLSDVANIIGNVSDGFAAVSDATGGVVDVVSNLKGLNMFGMFANAADGLERFTDGSLGAGDRVKGLASAVTSSIPVVGGLADGLFGLSDSSDDAAEAEERRAGAAAVAMQASKDAAAAAAEEETALHSLTDATLASFNSTLQLADAGDRTTKALADYATAAGTAEASSWGNKDANDAAAKAQRDAEQAALAQAAAAAKVADDQAKASGATLSAADSANIQADALRSVAGTMAADSPLRRSLYAYANQLEALPETQTTTIDADTQSASQKIAALTGQINAIVGKIFHVQVGATTSAPSTSSTAASASNVVPITAAPSAAAMGVSSWSAAPVVVYDVSVHAGPIVGNQAELGRIVADALAAHERRIGARRRFI